MTTSLIRDQFTQCGYAVIPNALTDEAVDTLTSRVSSVYADEIKGGPARSLHLLSFLDHDPAFLELVDHPSVLPHILDILGDNIYIYLSHLDVHPAPPAPSDACSWHYDMPAIGSDIGAKLSAPISVKVGFYLCDLLNEDCGPIYIASSSGDGTPEPSEKGEPIFLSKGSALLLDHRVSHHRGCNTSTQTRMAVFLAYTYRWMRPHDCRRLPDEHIRSLSPIRRQLLDIGPNFTLDADTYYRPEDEDIPLRSPAGAAPSMGAHFA
jgi:ectoine hydroxylase-related dioxygenase (phytanoyl-CoA dioxygenase family)